VPYNDSGSLTGPLAVFNGITAYGTSAKGGTLAAYQTVCRDVFGGAMNMRRVFTGWPEPGDPLAVTSSKSYAAASMQDASAAFAAYKLPSLFAHHHEPTGKNPDGTPEVPAADWRARNAAWRGYLPANVAQGGIFMGQDARDGKCKEFLPTRPPWLTWLGFDAYCLDVVNGKSPAQLFGACAAEAERLGVPWGLCETGLAGPAHARLAWFDEAVRWWCANRHMLFVINFQSDVGARAPTNYDGTVSWSAEKASDRANPELAEKWRSLAHMTRKTAAANGNTVPL
jgi:hypothetical protein